MTRGERRTLLCRTRTRTHPRRTLRDTTLEPPTSDLNHTHRPPTSRETSSAYAPHSANARRPPNSPTIHCTALKRLMALPRTRRLPRGLFRRRVPPAEHLQYIPCAQGQTGRLRRFRVPSACSAAGISWSTSRCHLQLQAGGASVSTSTAGVGTRQKPGSERGALNGCCIVYVRTRLGKYYRH